MLAPQQLLILLVLGGALAAHVVRKRLILERVKRKRPSDSSICEDGGGVWQDEACYDSADHATCHASGMIWLDGACTTASKLACENTGGDWTGEDCLPPQCPPGYERLRVAGECVQSCVDGEQRVDGVCVESCADGEQRVDGVCEATETKDDEDCPEGQVRESAWFGLGSCVAEDKDGAVRPSPLITFDDVLSPVNCPVVNGISLAPLTTAEGTCDTGMCFARAVPCPSNGIVQHYDRMTGLRVDVHNDGKCEGASFDACVAPAGSRVQSIQVVSVSDGVNPINGDMSRFVIQNDTETKGFILQVAAGAYKGAYMRCEPNGAIAWTHIKSKAMRLVSVRKGSGIILMNIVTPLKDTYLMHSNGVAQLGGTTDNATVFHPLADV